MLFLSWWHCFLFSWKNKSHQKVIKKKFLNSLQPVSTCALTCTASPRTMDALPQHLPKASPPVCTDPSPLASSKTCLQLLPLPAASPFFLSIYKHALISYVLERREGGPPPSDPKSLSISSPFPCSMCPRTPKEFSTGTICSVSSGSLLTPLE